jgi:hypothetical protein
VNAHADEPIDGRCERTTCWPVQPKAFVTTTDSNHALEIYLNLARRMTLTGINQLWVSDITYIRLPAEFVYLAVILCPECLHQWTSTQCLSCLVNQSYGVY